MRGNEEALKILESISNPAKAKKMLKKISDADEHARGMSRKAYREAGESKQHKKELDARSVDLDAREADIIRTEREWADRTAKLAADLKAFKDDSAASRKRINDAKRTEAANAKQDELLEGRAKAISAQEKSISYAMKAMKDALR